MRIRVLAAAIAVARVSMAAAIAVAGVSMTAACTSDGGESGTGSEAASRTKVGGTVAVFAAASLTESFTTISHRFEADHPGTAVALNFASSSALATQINQGAPADVFASAAPTNMTAVTSAGNIAGTPVIFVKNQLVIAVPRGNPKKIMRLTDLATSGMKVALCAQQVPCGAASKKVLTSANVTMTPVTLEPDVKAALSKVKLGEVDAALVYRTDVRASASSVDGVEFAESATAINEYPIAVCANAPNGPGARAFVAYVQSDRGREVLLSAGFQAP